MKSPRYTILIANRNSGAVRRLTISRRAAVIAFMGLAAVPLCIGLGASTSDPVELQSLRLANQSLQIENDSYKTATGELADQISSLQGALSQLSDQAVLDPAAKQAIDRLPAVIRSRAAGGGSAVVSRSAAPVPAVTESTDGTLDVLRGLLGALEDRLASVKTKIEGQQELAKATPSIWPIAGWLSSGFGARQDPFDGSQDFHSGLDISADKGTPIRATADGTVQTASYNGNYGNSILIEHGFGISTRFGHLSAYNVRAGQHVNRGDVIGFVGATGRSTGAHLHYEILLNGQPINPLRLLAKP